MTKFILDVPSYPVCGHCSSHLGIENVDFDLFPMAIMDDGYLRFEVAAIARWKYQSIYPRAVEIFSELR